MLLFMGLSCSGPPPADSVGPRRHVQAGAEPHLVWNAFIDLLAMEEYESLSPAQRPLHLAFWYDSEVQNGGHYQYFENRHGKWLNETVAALLQLGLACQAKVLRGAATIWQSRERRPAKTAEDFAEAAMDGDFAPSDGRYYTCTPTVTEILEVYLAQNEKEFVIRK